MFGSLWLWTISGAAMTKFQRAIGTPDWAFGLLAALPFLGALVQLPASWWINTRGQRRSLFLVCGTLGRLAYVAVGLVPWVMPGASGVWWPVVAASLLMGWVAMQATGPAWMNWMADVIPHRIRGRYFSMRALLTTPVAIVTILASAVALDHVETQHPDALLALTSGMLIFAGLMGAADILVFLWVRDPYPGPPTHATPPTLRSLFAPLRDRGFRRYVVFNVAFNFALAFIGQYIWLYALDVLAWSNLKANVLVAAVPLALHMLTRPVWGRLIDTVGKRPVLLISWSMVSVGAVGWLLITRDGWAGLWPGYALVVLVALAWPGVEVANFNFLLEYSHRKAAGSQATALNSVAVAVAGALSGFLAGGIAAWLGRDWVWTLQALGGVVVTYHGVLMLASTGARLIALVLAWRLEEPTAKGTRESIVYVTAGVWNNVRAYAGTPTRVAGSTARWAYRIDKSRKR